MLIPSATQCPFLARSAPQNGRRWSESVAAHTNSTLSARRFDHDWYVWDCVALLVIIGVTRIGTLFMLTRSLKYKAYE